MPPRKTLPRILDDLESLYGRPEPPKVTDPLEQILWENVGYLVRNEQRAVAFEALRKRVGLTPERILAAPPEVLREVASLGGILPDLRVQKLLTIAEVARKRFKGKLRASLRRPFAEAKKALKRFPGIGDPGAEKILLFSGSRPILALDSNGLRVLVRLGFGEDKKTYAATYKGAQDAVRPQLKQERGWLIRAHLLLHRHGQEICRRSQPRCEICPVSNRCAYYARMEG